jgi:hypothetical protein
MECPSKENLQSDTPVAPHGSPKLAATNSNNRASQPWAPRSVSGLKRRLSLEVELFGVFAKRLAARRRRAALRRIDLSDRSRTPLAEERGVTPIPLRLSDLEALRELGEAKLADEYLGAWEEWKARHPQKEGKRRLSPRGVGRCLTHRVTPARKAEGCAGADEQRPHSISANRTTSDVQSSGITGFV